MVQRHAARFTLNKFARFASVTEMLNTVGWPTLESSYNMMRTEMMYKIMNNLVDVPTDTILLPSSLRLRGHSEKNSTITLQSGCLCLLLFSTRNQIMERFTPAPNKFYGFINFKKGT